MKMKKTVIFSAMGAVLFGCSGKSIDLSQIDFTKNANEYLSGLNYSSKEEQKGHYQVVYDGDNVSLELKDDGERVMNYKFSEKNTKPLNYGGLQIDGNLISTEIKVYEDKICFIRTYIGNSQTIELVNFLKQKLGKPTEIVTREVQFYEDNNSLKLLLEKLPEETKKIKDETCVNRYEVSFPEHCIWVNNDVIFQLTLMPTGNVVDNTLVIISKKAFRDKIIMFFHNPDKDPILSKYLE
jgi:hypothetical protein